MAVRKIRNSWWVDLRFDGIRHRKRSPENSRPGALAYEAVLRQRLVRGELISGRRETARSQTFTEFSEKWFQEYVIPNNKHSEQRTKKYILSRSLVPFFGHMPIAEIGVRDIERYKAACIGKGFSRKTVNNKLTVLRKCLHTAYDWLGIESTPPKIVWLKCPPCRTDYLSPDECDMLLRHSRGIVREMVLAALRTGMRQGELKGLQWTSVDWLNRSVTVRHTRSDFTKTLGSPKGNRERHIPLDIDLFEALNVRKCDTGYVFVDDLRRPFSHPRLSRALAGVCKRAGLRKIGWHTLRHTFASHLAMKGIPLHIVQTLLGHASIATTMRYAHVAPSALRSAIALANPRTADDVTLGQPAGNNHWLESQLRRRRDGSEHAETTSGYADGSPGDTASAA